MGVLAWKTEFPSSSTFVIDAISASSREEWFPCCWFKIIQSKFFVAVRTNFKMFFLNLVGNWCWFCDSFIMKTRMLFTRHHLEIFYSIIQFISVNVMNLLRSCNIPSEKIRHDKSMFWDIAVLPRHSKKWFKNHFVSFLGNKGTSPESRRATFYTKAFKDVPNICLRTIKHFCNFCCRFSRNILGDYIKFIQSLVSRFSIHHRTPICFNKFTIGGWECQY